ncbi:MAG: glycosyltransferase family 4 protein [Ardenticatenaceae bacterium]|nr:glycosyltransferase family 4 protein [Ardenticatenaceae bacterium]
MPKVLVLRQSSIYLGLERMLLEVGSSVMQRNPTWQIDLLLLMTRRGLTPGQLATLPARHALLGEAWARGLTAWQWDDAGKIAPRQWVQLLYFVRSQGYDIVHTQEHKSNFLGALLQRWSGVRIVATLHGYPQAYRRMQLYRRIDRHVLRRFDHVVAVSEALRRELIAGGVRPERLSTVHNGIDIHAFRAQVSDLPALPQTVGGPVVTTVARLSAEKGIEYLLESAAMLRARFPAARFVIVGEGPLRSHLEAQANRLGLINAQVVSFLGHRHDVASLMAQSDVVILPSLRDGCPMVLIEALALGRPVVASWVDGIPEIVEDGVSGLLVPPGDSRALAAAIERLLVDRELATTLARQGMRRVEETFDVAAMAERTLAVYQQVLERPPRHAP